MSNVCFELKTFVFESDYTAYHFENLYNFKYTCLLEQILILSVNSVIFDQPQRSHPNSWGGNLSHVLKTLSEFLISSFFGVSTSLTEFSGVYKWENFIVVIRQ